MSWTAQKINTLFNPHRTLLLGALGLKITREGQFFGDTGREEGRDEEGRSKGAGRKEGGRMQEEGRAEAGRKEEGGDVGGSRDE